MSSFVFVGGPMDGECKYHRGEPPVLRAAELQPLPALRPYEDYLSSVRSHIREHEYLLDEIRTRDFTMSYYRHRELEPAECFRKIINHLANGILREGPTGPA